jgi:CO/xanthine dehydrogenase Mo-binding subunit
MANARMTDYIIPSSLDLPPITVEFIENAGPHGPGGAKGIGELPMDGPAPAILNAVHDALGLDVRLVPLTPEVLLETIAAAGESAEAGDA